MIRRLILKNFKGIKNADIELEPLSIFIGSNNSGKTSILEALYLAPNPVRRAPYIINGQSASALRVLHYMHETLESKGYMFLMNDYFSKNMKIMCFLDDKIWYDLAFQIQGDGILIKSVIIDPSDIDISNNSENSIDTRFDRFDLVNHFAKVSGKAESTGIQNNRFFADSLFINDDLLKNAYNYFREIWANIVNTGILTKVAKKASKLSNDKYSDFTIEPHLSNQLSFNAYFKDGKRIRVGDLGQGMQNFIVAHLLYEHGDYGAILWDDIEAHLNPRILLDMAMWFYDLVEQKKQVVISTHSLDVIKTMCGVNEEKAAIYLTKLMDGKLEYIKMNYEEFEKYLKSGIDVRVAEGYLL